MNLITIHASGHKTEIADQTTFKLEHFYNIKSVEIENDKLIVTYK